MGIEHWISNQRTVVGSISELGAEYYVYLSLIVIRLSLVIQSKTNSFALHRMHFKNVLNRSRTTRKQLMLNTNVLIR